VRNELAKQAHRPDTHISTAPRNELGQAHLPNAAARLWAKCPPPSLRIAF